MSRPARDTCVVLSRGRARWCGERGAFVQFVMEDGILAGDKFESTEREFGRYWRRVSGERFKERVRTPRPKSTTLRK